MNVHKYSYQTAHRCSRRDVGRLIGATAAATSLPLLYPIPASALWQFLIRVVIRGIVRSAVSRRGAVAGAALVAVPKKAPGAKLTSSVLTAGLDATIYNALETHDAVWFQKDEDEKVARNGVSVHVRTTSEPLRGKLIMLVKDADSGLVEINYDSEYINMESDREGTIHFSAPSIQKPGSKVVETYFEDTKVAPPSKVFVLEGTYST